MLESQQTAIWNIGHSLASNYMSIFWGWNLSRELEWATFKICKSVLYCKIGRDRDAVPGIL